MRGKLDHNAKDMPHRGLIPAYAGKTTAGVLALSASAAHPRVCGENPVSSNRAAVTRGSSPRMRGKRAGPGRSGGPCGLIPAYAGKTRVGAGSVSARSAHPRVCGENLPKALPMISAAGSSPRMRGKPRSVGGIWKVSRLIPAYAGKTGSAGYLRTRQRAHPRVCGENLTGPCVPCRPRGSSPRMRGKRKSRCRCRDETGLIPAYAGKTARRAG